MTERQAIGRDTTFAYPTSQSREGSDVAESEEERDNNNLLESVLYNGHFLPSKPTPPLVVPSEILSRLTNISKINTPPLPEAFQDLDEDLQSSGTTNQPGSSCQSHSKFGVIKHVDYKHPRKPEKALLVIHNVFYAKRLS